MSYNDDDVGNIHRRYYFTLLTPPPKISLIASSFVVSIITALVCFFFLENEEFFIRVIPAIAFLLISQFVDSKFIRNKEYSKALHMSLFGNVIWLITLTCSIIASTILSAELALFFVVEGMFLVSSFRIGISTTTLGLNLPKAWTICFIQPLGLLLILLPIDSWSVLIDQNALIFGATFMVIASVWSYLTDRAGKPGIDSTHEMVQAYLFSMSQGDSSDVEKIIEKKASKHSVMTSQILLKTNDEKNRFRFILPEIHPGPFYPVGGSNIPYMIYKTLDSSAMVMHSISDHTLNLPSQTEVQSYLNSLDSFSKSGDGLMCTEPVIVQINRSRVSAIAFEKTAVLFLSLSPSGMEDVPLFMKNEIEQFAKNRDFERVMVVDCHNAMGPEIPKSDSDDMLTASKSALDELKKQKSHPIKFGYANSEGMDIHVKDLAGAGLGVLCLEISSKKFYFCWADANNMDNGVREKILEHLKNNGYNMIELCTSDTHFTSTGVKNRNGYYELGKVTPSETLANWYLEIAKKAESNISSGSFEVLENKTSVKVMGSGIFNDFSKALDNSLNVTKIFMSGSVALFLFSMFFRF